MNKAYEAIVQIKTNTRAENIYEALALINQGVSALMLTEEGMKYITTVEVVELREIK